MKDATIVIENGLKGGSMINVELVKGYNQEVFAFPGRATDPRSAGCNELIRLNKAMLITESEQLLELMGWVNKPSVKKNIQRALFIEMSGDEKRIVQILQEKENVQIEEISRQT